VCQWERGNRRIAFLAVCAVAQVLGVPVAEFVPPSMATQP
jgi:transcriptional regulator with XRE-family HTH domain